MQRWWWPARSILQFSCMDVGCVERYVQIELTHVQTCDKHVCTLARMQGGDASVQAGAILGSNEQVQQPAARPKLQLPSFALPHDQICNMITFGTLKNNMSRATMIQTLQSTYNRPNPVGTVEELEQQLMVACRMKQGL